MPGMNFQQALAFQQRSARTAGLQLLAACTVGWAILIASAAGLGHLADRTGAEPVLSLPWALYAGLVAFLFHAIATAVFSFIPHVQLDVEDEPNALDQFTGGRAFMAQFIVVWLLFIPQMTAHALIDLNKSRGLPAHSEANARKIYQALLPLNDWVPRQTFLPEKDAVKALLRMDILHQKPVHGVPYIRVNPSL
ncbi:MAG: hypothetical protein ACPGYV_08995, partial [Phycisphaeraceae bacterium]